MKRRLDVVLALLAFAALAAWIGWRASVALDLDLRVATDDGVSSSPAIDETARGSNAAARELDPLVDDSTRADSALAFDPGAARTPVAPEPAGVVWRESEIVTCAVDELGRGIDGVSIEFHSYPPGFESQLHDWGHFEDVDSESPRAPRVTPAFLGERTVQAPDANSSAATDDASTGCFSVTWFLAAGTEFRTTATLRALGFEPLDVEIAMLAGEVQRATYVLTRTRPEIGGHVVDERGTPLSEIVLELHGDPTLARERVTSDAHGAFEFPLTRRSEARALLVFRGKNVVATLAPERLGLGMEVVLARAGSVRGRLRSASGGFVPRARVQLSSHRAHGSPTWFEPSVVAELGEYEFLDAPAGDLVLNVWLEAEPGHWKPVLAQPFELASGVERTLDVVVPALP